MNPTDSPKPAGWKIVPSSSKPSASYYLQSPSGKIYPTYLAAVRHLNYFDSNQEEIEILKTGLVQEGWETKPGLPMKWFTKGEDGQRLFLSHDFLEFSSFAAAYDHLFKNKTSFEVDDLTMFYSTFSKPTKSKPTFLEQLGPNMDNASEKGPSPKIPNPSKINNKSSRKVDVTFNKLKYLVENGGSREEIDNVVAQLKQEGWVTYKNLTKGWLRTNLLSKSTSIQYLIYDPFCSKFGSKYSAVGTLKRMGLGKKYISKFIISDSDVEHTIGNENDDDWVADDDTVPAGWKIRKDKKISDPMAIEILSPDDICYRNRAAAVKHMSMEIARDVFSKDEIEQIRTKLSHEGWFDHTMIPEGWKVNRTQPSSSFLTKEGFVLPDFATALKLLKDPKTKYSIQDKKNFVEAGDYIKFNKTLTQLTVPSFPEKIASKEEKTVLLPEGWTFERLTAKIIKITSADGNEFYSRIQAIEFMIETGVEQEMIFSLWRTLEEEDWKFGFKFVPLGWAVREPVNGGDFLFLTREIEVLVNVEQALDYIENDDVYTAEDYKKLKKWNDNFMGVTWVEDEELPKGWKKTEDDDEEEQFSGPLGTIVNGRVALIEHLIKVNHPIEDIFSLWGTLDLEGWMNDNKNLPLGWKSKYFPELDEFHYLSPLMQVVKSEGDLVKLITDCKLTSPDEKLMVEHLKKWASNNYN